MRKNWLDIAFLALVLVVCTLASGLLHLPRRQAPPPSQTAVRPSSKAIDPRQATDALSAVLAPVSAPTSLALQYFAPKPIKD